MNLKNKKFVIIAVVVLIGGGFFGYKYFSKTTTSKIEINNTGIVEEIKTEEIENSPEYSGEKIETEKAEEAVAESKKNEEPKPAETTSSKVDITKKLMSSGYQKTSGRKIDTIIIHSSYDALGDEPYSVSGLIAEYKEYGVSAHYLIDRKGNIYQLVEDKNIAYHAGVAKLPDGRTNVNEVSIGIEMMNTKTEKFTEGQYKALNSLLSLLKEQYKVKYVLGHNQVAPGRKDDPWNFNWDKI